MPYRSYTCWNTAPAFALNSSFVYARGSPSSPALVGNGDPRPEAVWPPSFGLTAPIPALIAVLAEFERASGGRDLGEACRRADIDRVSPNILRQTFGNWHVAAGVPLFPVAQAMAQGHPDAGASLRAAER